ncbi:MAG: SBBP repeat-containing protein [Calditrichia bacterium]
MKNRYLFSVQGKTALIPLLIVLLFPFFSASMQAQDLLWGNRSGGGSSDSGLDIAVDASGNSYVTGHFEGEATFGEGQANETILNSVGFLDIFVAKYDLNGLLMWVRQAGGLELAQGLHISVDASGSSSVTGVFDGMVTFGVGEANETTLTSSGSTNIHDIFIARYDANGMLVWATRAGGQNSNDVGSSIAVDDFNNSYIAGYFSDSTIFGEGEANETTLSGFGSFDIFIAKYDANGLLHWAKEAGGISFEVGLGIAVNSSSQSYITGLFEGAITLGSGEANETVLTSVDGRDVFVAKYDADGLLLWAKRAGGPGNDEGFGIEVGLAGSNYITGKFEDTATFGMIGTNETILNSQGANDVFVAKLAADGTLLWAKQSGGSGNDQGAEIIVDASGNGYLTGLFEGVATFGAGEANETIVTSAGATDIFVTKYDSDGLVLWAKQAGGPSGDFSEGIGVDAFGNSYIAGQFEGFATFGAGEANETILTSAGSADIFVAKYQNNSPSSVGETLTQIDNFNLAQNYPNPFNPVTVITFEVPKAVQSTLAIYNLRGQLIRILTSGKILQGQHQAIWNGTDDTGREMASGIYFYRLNAGEFSATKKMILLQ